MPTEKTLEPLSFLEKCYVYWKTKNYGLKIEHIALLLSVAIFMNHKIYEEELESARKYLLSLLKDEGDVENVMEFIQMKLLTYQKDRQAWLEEKEKAFNLIVNDEELYGFMIDVFHSDESFSEDEQLFEATLKRLL